MLQLLKILLLLKVKLLRLVILVQKALPCKLELRTSVIGKEQSEKILLTELLEDKKLFFNS